MDEQRFLINGRTYPSGDPALQDALAVVHDTQERPRCMCARGGVEMYVARHRLYVVKRMPGTGPRTMQRAPPTSPSTVNRGWANSSGNRSSSMARSPSSCASTFH